MKTAPIYLGIDFGTTNSSVACVYADPRHRNAQTIGVKPVSFTMDEENHVTTARMPTLLSTRFDDRRAKGFAVGWMFSSILGRRKKLPLLRRGRELFESVKSDLGSHRIYANAASADCNSPRKVAGSILRVLLTEAATELRGLDISQVRAVITVPASLNAEARRETRDAAIDAGLNGNLIELIDEPVAALLHLLNEQSAASVLSTEESRNILVFDYGGGTLDLCLVKCRFNLDAPTGVQAETLAISQYRRNGGNDVDRAVMDEVMWPQIEQWIGKQRDELPTDLRQAVEDTLTSTLARRLKEKLCTKISKEMAVDGKAYPRVRGGLSETVPTGAEFFNDRLPKSIRGTFKITKEQFDDLMRPFLRVQSGESDPDSLRFVRSIIAPLRHCLEKAGLSPEDLDALVLHGGSCRNPYVVHYLKEVLTHEESLFGKTTIIQTPDLDTSVACGAALACYWKHERSVELIKPVTAEDIGIITLGGSAECLIESGTPLPFPTAGVHEHPADFYVAQNGQTELIVPFYAGRTEGRPHLSGSVKLPLPAGVQKSEVVKIKLSIDKDKILHWLYRVGDGPFRAATPFDDPWTPKQLDPKHRRLVAFRRRMEKHLESEDALPDLMLIDEVNLCRLAGDLDEAELLALDFVSTRDLTSRVANVLSLIYGEQRKRPDELWYGQEAVRLEPGNAVLVGNLGYVLVDAGRIDEGIAQMRRALGIDSNLTYLYEKLGDVARMRGDEAGAIREFRQAITILDRGATDSSKGHRNWRDLARLFDKIGDYDQARAARAQARNLQLDLIYGGDHRHVIAGPDSGF